MVIRGGVGREVSSRWSIVTAFFSAGVFQSTWFSRIPSVATELDLSVDRVSLLLLAFALGAVVGLTAAPVLTSRLGTAAAFRTAAVVMCPLMAATGLATTFLRSEVATIVGVGLFSAGYGLLDVSMNIGGAALERARGRSMMPQFHALYSLGALAGSAISLVFVALGATVAEQFALSAVFVAIMVPLASRSAATAARTSETGIGTSGSASPSRRFAPVVRRLRATGFELRHPWLLAVGAAVFCVTVVEGTGVNWIAVAAGNGRGRDAVDGSAALVAFMAATVVSRLAGGSLVDRFGRAAVLRGATVLALAGVQLFVLAPSLSLVGAALWGLGVALGMPLLISAASAGGGPGAGLRVGSVSAFAYGASFAGPPLVGLAAAAFGLLPTVSAAGLLLVVTVLFASAGSPTIPSSREPA